MRLLPMSARESSKNGTFLYRLILTILGLPLLLRFIWQGWKNGVKRYPKERLGFVSKWPDNKSRPVWFHATSVCEVSAIIPLLKALATSHPEQPILLTTTTITGFHNAQKHIPEIAHHLKPGSCQLLPEPVPN